MNKTSEVKQFLEKNKREREEWEKQNPNLVQKLKEKELDSSLTTRKTLPEIEQLCGIPNDSRYEKVFAGIVDVYTYHSGNCRRRALFDTGDGLTLTDLP